MNESDPKPVDPKAKGPKYPDQVRGNVYVVSPSGMNVKNLVKSLHFDLQEEGIFIQWKPTQMMQSNVELTFLALTD